MDGRSHSPAGRGGLVGGLAGGLAIAGVVAVHDVRLGIPIWMGAKLPAYPFLRERVLQPGFDEAAVTLGLAIHVSISIGWGLIFTLLFQGLSRPLTVMAGLFWGAFVWAAMYFAILPIVGAAGVGAILMPDEFGFFTHLLYGLVLAMSYLPFQHPIREADERLATP